MSEINTIGALTGANDAIDAEVEAMKEEMMKRVGPCSVCGKPTKSHIVDGKRICHSCYEKRRTEHGSA